MQKKGVEMSLNVIIVAAIGLLILVILVFLIIQGTGPLSSNIVSCQTKYAGTCQPNMCADYSKYVSGTNCDTNSKGEPLANRQYCCKTVG